MKQVSYAWRVMAVLVCMVLCLVLCEPCLSPKAEKAVRTVSNIVLFAQFPAEDGYNFMDADRTASIVDGLTRTDTVKSLYGYINAISYGQMQTECYFPQMDGDTIQPYVLLQPLESYTETTLALEIIRNAAIPADIPLDGDNDGYIDNFILVVDGKAASQKDTLWPHKSSAAYADVTINGKTAGNYNVHNSDSLFNTIAYSGCNVGVICHEFLHSVGYPDLYRGTGDNGGEWPVGTLWDIMAGSTTSLVSPLAYMRASRSGWLETTDITEDGTYTLAPSSADSGNRVYLLKTPVSDTEFFAVEFRKQGSYQSGLDIYCDTGMLVYRVNTAADGNRQTDGLINDEIYLFRQQDNNLYMMASFGRPGGNNFVGSLNPEDGLEDGAITYSNGVNSGIRIENITIDGDTLTFDVQFAQTDRQTVWHSVPNDAAFDWPGRQALAASDTGTVCLAGTKNNGKSVGLYRLTETSTTHISDLNISGEVYEIQLAVAGETPYLLYRDWDYRAVLAVCDPVSGAWQTLWQSEALAQDTAITAKGNQVYVCYTEGYRLRTFCYADGKIAMMGGIICESGDTPSLVCTDETVAVAYRDLGDGFTPKLALWEEGNWTRITLSEKSGGLLNAAADGTTITIAVSTGDAAGFYHYQNNFLTFTDYPTLPGMPLDVIPLYVSGTLVAAIHTQLDFNYTFYAYDGEWWWACGNGLETVNPVHCPTAAASGNVIYTAYKLGIGQSDGSPDPFFLKTLRFGDEVQSVPGDVNADGQFTVLDVVALQKWLLKAATSLPDAAAGDFDGNGILDIFDLCLMKRALLGI